MREKFGRFVLLEEVDHTGLGTEYRAAKLGPTGFERLVSLIRLAPQLAKTPDVAKDLLEHVKQAAQLQNPYILKVHGIGKIESQYYISYEFLEARNLRTILAQCRQEGFPFSVNHTLLIASKMCTALDYAQSRRAEDGRRFTHGLMNTSAVSLSNDGEVRVRFFGVWPSRVRESSVLRDDDRAYLAPEQRSGGLGDIQSDVYSIGAILFECLTGERFQQAGREEDVAARLASARLQDPSVDPRTIPTPIAEILKRALAQNPSGRYVQIDEMRKGIDSLLFSGDFTPTTFNLAFLMHSLFREQLERESKLIKQEREASYAEFLADEGPPPPTTAPPPPVPEIVSLRREPTAPMRLDQMRPEPTVMLSSDETAPHSVGVLRSEMARSGPLSLQVPRRSFAPLVAGGIGALLLVGAVTLWLLRGGRAASPTPPPVSPEVAGAMARVQELEARLKALEEEKLAAEAKAAGEAKAKIEAQARQRGQAVDPAAVQRAQEEATRRARAEQEQRNLELTRQLEQQRQVEAARLAQQQRQAAEAAAAVPTPVATVAPTPTPTPVPVAVAPTLTPEPLPSAIPESAPSAAPTGGALVPPTLQSAPRVSYPPVALRQRVEGIVEVRAFVDERGAVTETQVANGVPGKTGLNEAALENVRQRRYRPATRNGAPVGAWVTVRIEFRLPR